jgi:hypothetical protein
MDRRVSVWLAVSAIAVTGIIGVILMIVTLSGIESSGSGDLMVSPAMASGINLAVLVGTIVILGLEFMHVRRLRHRYVPAKRVLAPFRP